MSSTRVAAVALVAAICVLNPLSFSARAVADELREPMTISGQHGLLDVMARIRVRPYP
ncbi:MAG: hypothetical protein JOZ12_15565 [Sinobacteraceae bacterium]|nr:hypothetical protein [Nevskiaceae bacterium]MBV8852765.1 hypothetical protein [Nevskiaceae bacterium]